MILQVSSTRKNKKCRYLLQDLLDEDMPELPEDGKICEPYNILEIHVLMYPFWIGKWS